MPHAIGVTRLSLAISCVQGVWRPAWHTPLSCSVSAAAMGPLGDGERVQSLLNWHHLVSMVRYEPNTFFHNLETFYCYLNGLFHW